MTMILTSSRGHKRPEVVVSAERIKEKTRIRRLRSVREQDCYVCHGQGFCSNSACHNLSRPPDMLHSRADEYRRTGNQVCYNCHQDILCSRCHPGGVVAGP